jgi:nitrogen fixation protein FixH
MTAIRRGTLVPWIFVACMAVVVLVNAGMVTAALSTYSGLAHPDAFGRGIAYNKVLDALETQERLGWQVGVDLGSADAAGLRRITVSLADRDGRHLTGGKVSAVFVRPVEKTGMVEAGLVEEMIGRHIGAVTLPARGQWDVRVTVERSGDRIETRQRIFAK